MSEERIDVKKIKEVIHPSDLLSLSINSYSEFLQLDKEPSKRKNVGLEYVFRSFFPVENYNRTLEYHSYRIVPQKKSYCDCIRDGDTYAASLYLTLSLKSEDSVQKSEVYMGEIPLMTPRASFVVNGVERTVVNQLHRSPGIVFEERFYSFGKRLPLFRIIPDRGVWLGIEFDQNDLLGVTFDTHRRRSPILVTTLLRAWGYETDESILKLFYEPRMLSVASLLKQSQLTNLVLAEDVLDVKQGRVLAGKYEILSKLLLQNFVEAKIEKIKVIDCGVDGGIIVRCLKNDLLTSAEDAAYAILSIVRPGQSIVRKNALASFRYLFAPENYDLLEAGRYVINEKLGLNDDQRTLQPSDLVAAIRYLYNLRKGEGVIDDIDCLSNRRVRLVGELIGRQCRLGLERLRHTLKERMVSYSQFNNSLQTLMNTKVMAAAINEFFARNQLSQIIDQINPLSEVSHKRRLSALGPGGLNRERAGLGVRDVQTSHYGRICPVETSEGANIGLINSLTTYARINPLGFIETPYRVVKKGVPTDTVHYLTADQEKNEIVAQANAPVDSKGKLVGPVLSRRHFDVYEADPQEVTYMDVSPKQVVSVAAALIPFLEHDDGSRALMGANMQRQAVPLLCPKAPLVGTGVESLVAKDSRSVIIAESDGKIAAVDGGWIVVTPDGKLPAKSQTLTTDPKKGIYVYHLNKFMRSNASTCINQRPIVHLGEKVTKGQILSDGMSMDHGELALGSDVMVAYMPWYGYNFEDAIILSDRIVKEDVFTSIHIEEYETLANDTKLGPEEITRDIPNVSEEALSRLDRNGIICIGSEVRPGDILVGKITPKGETELSPEEKLLRTIFGEKAADVKDSSMMAPPGCTGIVMEVRVSRGDNVNPKEEVTEKDLDRKRKKIDAQYALDVASVRDDLTEALSNIFLGEKISLNIVDADSGDFIVKANKKITKTALRSLAANKDHLSIEDSPVKEKLDEILTSFNAKFDELKSEYEGKIKHLEDTGSEEGPIKKVTVLIAVKRKIQVGDKMAGRHGNKGVVSRIVPQQDMPFLANGKPVDIILNPLGVPSRMNVGQVLECHLGWACKALGIRITTPIFDGASEKSIKEFLKKAKLPESGKVTLYDGYTGDPFYQQVTVGYTHMLKLNHLVANKVHARAVGPYSLITQQPLGGKAQFGGQRFGEMEVWALEAYGAAYLLKEMITVKSDDVQGRVQFYESIVKGKHSLHANLPQSFLVLLNEMRGLAFDVRLISPQQEATSF